MFACRAYPVNSADQPLGFWFRVEGSRVSVWGLGFGIGGLGFRV